VAQIWVYRVAIWVLPVLAFFMTRRLCLELQQSDRLKVQRRRAEEEASAETASG
jgi:hypothetical protein